MMIRYIIMILFTWGLIYSVPVFPVNMRHIVGVAGYIYVCVHWGRTKKLLLSRDSVRVIVCMAMMLLYLMIVANFKSGDFQITSFYLYWLVDVIPGIVLLVDYAKGKSLSLPYILLLSAILQAACSLAAFISPGVQHYFLEIMSASGRYTDEFAQRVSQWRMFGLASGLFFDMPLLQSFIGCATIAFGMKQKGWLIPFGILMIISAVINARVSLVVCAAALAIGGWGFISEIIIKKSYNKYKLIKGLIFLLMVLGILEIVAENLQNNATVKWIYTAGSAVATAETKGTIHTLLYLMMVFPDGLGMLFGEGIRTIGGNAVFSVASDVGYVNDCWSGGVIYMFVKYFLFVYIVHKTRFGLGKYYGIATARQYEVLALAVLFLCNFKGQVFSPNCFTIFLLVAYYSFIPYGRKMPHEV